MASKTRLTPETLEAIAERRGKPVPEMQTIPDTMVKNGQSGCLKEAGLTDACGSCSSDYGGCGKAFLILCNDDFLIPISRHK